MANAAALEATEINRVTGGSGARVSVWRPQVERNRGDFEAQRDDQQDQAQQQDRIACQVAVCHGGADCREARRPDDGVDQRERIDENARGQAAKDEVLQASLVRALIFLEVANQHVDRQRLQLEPHKDADQVGAACHDHHADERYQHEEVVLGKVCVLVFQESGRGGNGEGRGYKKKHREEAPEGVDG